MKKELICLRCGKNMRYFACEELQLGKTSLLWGTLPNMMAGAMETDIYVCPTCGKLEFFTAEDVKTEGIAQVKCPDCGKMHDMDCPKCPFCKHSYI